jgi:acyl carrier protein
MAGEAIMYDLEELKNKGDYVDIRTTIVDTISELLFEETGEETVLNENVILLESGLDSLGLAVLIVRLEGILGYDPFTISDTAYYPRTLSELITFYEEVGTKSENSSN